jgi:hypothetical protein
MIRMGIIFVAIAIPRERIACEGVFAAIAPDFVIIGPPLMKLFPAPVSWRGLPHEPFMEYRCLSAICVFMTPNRQLHRRHVSTASPLKAKRSACSSCYASIR